MGREALAGRSARAGIGSAGLGRRPDWATLPGSCLGSSLQGSDGSTAAPSPPPSPPRRCSHSPLLPLLVLPNLCRRAPLHTSSSVPAPSAAQQTAACPRSSWTRLSTYPDLNRYTRSRRPPRPTTSTTPSPSPPPLQSSSPQSPASPRPRPGPPRFAGAHRPPPPHRTSAISSLWLRLWAT